MANLTINVLVTQQGVAARTNLAKADREDTLTWEFIPDSETFHIVFREIELPDGSRRSIPSGEGPIRGPFSTVGGKVHGAVAADAQGGLYFYDIHDQAGRKLHWLNPMGPSRNFGGLRIPPPPPGG